MKGVNKNIEEIREILHRTFKVDKEQIHMETELHSGGLELSSIQLMELTMAIENYYGEEFDPDDLTEENFATVGSLCNLIEKCLLNLNYSWVSQ